MTGKARARRAASAPYGAGTATTIAGGIAPAVGDTSPGPGVHIGAPRGAPRERDESMTAPRGDTSGSTSNRLKRLANASLV